jgi:hypothetical protein
MGCLNNAPSLKMFCWRKAINRYMFFGRTERFLPSVSQVYPNDDAAERKYPLLAPVFRTQQIWALLCTSFFAPVLALLTQSMNEEFECPLIIQAKRRNASKSLELETVWLPSLLKIKSGPEGQWQTVARFAVWRSLSSKD